MQKGLLACVTVALFTSIALAQKAPPERVNPWKRLATLEKEWKKCFSVCAACKGSGKVVVPINEEQCGGAIATHEVITQTCADCGGSGMAMREKLAALRVRVDYCRTIAQFLSDLGGPESLPVKHAQKNAAQWAAELQRVGIAAYARSIVGDSSTTPGVLIMCPVQVEGAPADAGNKKQAVHVWSGAGDQRFDFMVILPDGRKWTDSSSFWLTAETAGTLTCSSLDGANRVLPLVVPVVDAMNV